MQHAALYGGILRLFAYAVSIAFVFMFLNVIPKRKLFITTLGERSMSVYVFHYVFIHFFVHSFLYKALLHRFPNTWELILVGIGFVVALICSLKPFDVFCKAILANKKKYRLDDE